MEENKILYFDDEPFLNSALARSLELFDWNVTIASEVDNLFKELRTHHFNILILDIMATIPDMENKYVNFTSKEIDEMNMGINVGVVLAKKIWEELKMNIPILFLSAKRNPITENPELNNYKCYYLRKPQMAKAVDEKLRELLNT